MIATTLGSLLALLFVGIPVAATLILVALILSGTFSFLPLHYAIGEIAWTVSNNFLLIAIPLFVLLGEILLRSGLASRMYSALVLWMPWLPGGLMHSNIAACTMFAATSGSSVATAATIGTVALQEIDKNSYNERLFLGSIAAGGTLGILIPPSVNLILYGVLTETSIPQLYLAGLIPGLLLAGLFMVLIGLVCLVKPEWGGTRQSASWSQRLRALPDLLPPLVIFVSVIGSIYAGWATATEAAALGVLAALVIAAVYRCLSVRVVVEAFEGAMKTTAMIMAVMIGAYFLNLIFGAIGLPQAVSGWIGSLNLSPLGLFALVVVFYFILGMFMETLSMMVASVPIIAPIMVQAGFDPVWCGIVIVLLMEIALITPPVGLNLFVVQSVRRRGYVEDVIVGALPFMLVMLAFVGILYLWPQIALFLPNWR
ncbi:TRAP transporter large permease [Cereibacter johrii]|uniref:TRAP transporter large permease n=1 Tax=Cereibacter johrii TaxID=445629 RepID=UPI000E1CF9B6|nr:TRAP transporter large permease [Cereibacter johrii]MEA5159872.1 TRAP transporter large permease [Cereibacter johrii]RDS97348.1 TRAP transporter large permease [Cereibacter sphaeroides f. sp. denitrificans]